MKAIYLGQSFIGGKLVKEFRLSKTKTLLFSGIKGVTIGDSYEVKKDKDGYSMANIPKLVKEDELPEKEIEELELKDTVEVEKHREYKARMKASKSWGYKSLCERIDEACRNLSTTDLEYFVQSIVFDVKKKRQARNKAAYNAQIKQLQKEMKVKLK